VTSSTPAAAPVPDPAVGAADRTDRVLFAVLGAAAAVLLVVAAVASIQAVPAARAAQEATLPVAFLGLATQPIVVTVAVAGFARTRLPRWFRHATTVGTLAALAVVVVLLVGSFADGGAALAWGVLATVAAGVAAAAALRLSARARRDR